MATYVIGDIQGCFSELEQLLELISFDISNDKLVFAGDLVNRGPHSLETLRFVKNLGSAADTVLGNHDLHLLAIWQGNSPHASGDSLEPVFQAADSEELLEWLRHRPLLIHIEEFSSTIIHAGLPPQWSLQDARRYAHEMEAVLRSDTFHLFLQQMYGNKPKKWDPGLQGMDRLRFITNAFTRLRYCTGKGKMNLKDKGAPGTQKQNTLPWFDVKGRKTSADKIFFGHWSTLGLLNRNNTWSLDTGCLWGGHLTAIRLDDLQLFQLKCEAYLTPKASN
jgi:bis(5'-nucleosyl)-tetraphosphatase (symmetrical)